MFKTRLKLIRVILRYRRPTKGTFVLLSSLVVMSYAIGQHVIALLTFILLEGKMFGT